MRAELSSFYVQKSQSDHGEQRSPGTTCKAILLSCCCLTSASVTHLHLYISVVSMNTHSNILATCSYSVLFYTLPGSFRSPPRPNMRFWGSKAGAPGGNPHTLSKDMQTPQISSWGSNKKPSATHCTTMSHYCHHFCFAPKQVNCIQIGLCFLPGCTDVHEVDLTWCFILWELILWAVHKLW